MATTNSRLYILDNIKQATRLMDVAATMLTTIPREHLSESEMDTITQAIRKTLAAQADVKARFGFTE